MKKYIAAGGVAVVAFAFAASAASLNVNANTLQVGEDLDLECADAAYIAAWGYDDTDGTNLFNVAVQLEGAEDCTNGEVLHLLLLDDAGSQLVRPVSRQDNGKAYADIDPTGDGRYLFDTDVDARLVEGVRIGIDQGHADYSS